MAIKVSRSATVTFGCGNCKGWNVGLVYIEGVFPALIGSVWSQKFLHKQLPSCYLRLIRRFCHFTKLLLKFMKMQSEMRKQMLCCISDN
jgi:hypothetical protein